MWDKENLQELIKKQMSDYLFVVVSNRQPYVHTLEKGRIKCRRGAGGVITALDPVMQACNGLWIAFGSGDADRKASDEKGRIQVPPDNPKYTLKRLFLTKEEEKGYYLGYSNEALWPLCHTAFQRPVFRADDWNYYVEVNKKFAEAVLEEIGDNKAFVWIQDYHLTLLPKFLKEMAPEQLIVAHFWHIPWPNYEVFRICPQRQAILEGLLSNDLLGFHIRYHCDNFIDVVDRDLECKIDRERVSIIRKGRETLVRPFPISVDFEGITQRSKTKTVEEAMENLREEFSVKGKKILLGIDRIDYTKGIPERLLAIDTLLTNHPELKEKIVFMQIGAISRIHIPKYKILNDEINGLVEEINWRHSTDNWKPIVMMRRHLSFDEILAFYRIGDVCIVSSLHDGMNLVAKEFICARSDKGGMLILSRFTGAARELTDAVMVNPYNIQKFSEDIFSALFLDEKERKRRMQKMRRTVKENNIYRWAGKVLSELLKFEFRE